MSSASFMDVVYAVPLRCLFVLAPNITNGQTSSLLDGSYFMLTFTGLNFKFGWKQDLSTSQVSSNNLISGYFECPIQCLLQKGGKITLGIPTFIINPVYVMCIMSSF